MTDKPPSPGRPIVRGISLAALLALVAVPLAALTYETFRIIIGGGLNPTTVKIVPIDASANTLSNYTFSFSDRPTAVPSLAFVDGSQRPLSLSDFRGRPVLLNIWATWCVPCRKEMPSLDRLQTKFDPLKFQVVTLSIDHQGIPAVEKFYEQLGLKSLGVYVDPSGAASNKLRLPGVPGTLLIDAEGNEIGRKLGPAEWDSPEVVALLRQHLGLEGGAEGKGR